MPLKPGASVGDTIRELYHHGSRPRSRDQIIAIAEANSRRRKPYLRRAAGGIGAAAPTGFTGENPLNAGEKGGEGAGWSGNDFGNAGITMGGFIPGAPMGLGLAAGVGKGIFDDISHGGDQPNNNNTSFWNPAGTSTGEKAYWGIRNFLGDTFGGKGAPPAGPNDQVTTESAGNASQPGKGSMGLGGALSSAYNSIVGTTPGSSTTSSMSGPGSVQPFSGTPATTPDVAPTFDASGWNTSNPTVGQTNGSMGSFAPGSFDAFGGAMGDIGGNTSGTGFFGSMMGSNPSGSFQTGSMGDFGSMGDMSAAGKTGGMARGGLALGGPSYFERTEARMMNDPFHPGGLITSDVGGRTDRIAHSVAADSFVMPADVVSGLGQGNTLAGAKIMDGILSSGPFGTPLPRSRRADGGSAPADGLSHVLVAGGEYTVPRHKVDELGNRMRRTGKSRARTDNAAGQEALRGLVDSVRKHTKKFLASAPKPKA